MWRKAGGGSGRGSSGHDWSLLPRSQFMISLHLRPLQNNRLSLFGLKKQKCHDLSGL